MRRVLLLLFLASSLYGRLSSEPFISGDTFRAYANHVFDETGVNFDPAKVKEGDTIFVKVDFLENFFRAKHPYIKNRYVLITHNGDLPTPGVYVHYLNDRKIIAWFAQNVENCIHTKLIPIPIGVANRYWGHGSFDILSECSLLAKSKEKEHLLYMNINVGTYQQERQRVVNLFRNRSYVFASREKPFKEYLLDLAASKFVLSPRGNGIDCHRTWEALYMGAIPIVRSSSSDLLYKGLPVLIVQDWEEITEELLLQKWEELSPLLQDLEPIYYPYWHARIQKARAQA